MGVLKGDKGLTALTPEIDCNQTAMGLPPVTSAVFLQYSSASLWRKKKCLEEISEMPLDSFGNKA
jgi:hypothetical protein